MRRYFPPASTYVRRLFYVLGMTMLTVFPLRASAEVTLETTVERISTAVTLPAGELPATSAPQQVYSGDVLRYTITFENTSSQDVAAGSVVITNPLPEDTLYLEGSATGDNTLITYSVDGETFASPAELRVGEGAGARAATAGDIRAIRWTYEPLLPAGASSMVSFELLIP